MPHLYIQAEREAQLQSLIADLRTLIFAMTSWNLYPEEQGQYETALADAERLLVQGFTQEELSNLCSLVPRLFWLNKEWIPELEPEPGKHGYRVPPWFEELEPLEKRVVDSAFMLRCSGET